MSECKWYQFECKRRSRQEVTTDIIPTRIEDLTDKQLKMVAGFGLAILVSVGLFTR